MFKGINNIITEFDTFSYNPSFFSKQNYIYKTLLGGIMVVITMLLNASGIIYFSKDIYQKRRPNLSQSNIIQKDFPKIEVPKNEFLLAVSLNSYSRNYENFRDHKIFIPIFYFNRIENGILVSSKQAVTRACTREDFAVENLDQFLGENYIYDRYECLDDQDKFFVNGTLNGFSVNYLQIHFYTCRNYYKGSKDIDKLCVSENELDDFFKKGSSSDTVYFSKYYTPEDYFSPIKTFIQRDLTQVVPNAYVFQQIFLNTIEVIDDIGVFFQNLVSKSFFSVQSFDSRTTPIEIGYFKEIIVSMGATHIKYYRNYKRLQDVVANVGGLLSFITGLSMIITRYTSSIIYLNELADSNFHIIKKDATIYGSIKNYFSKHFCQNKNPVKNLSKNSSVLCMKEINSPKNTPKNNNIEIKDNKKEIVISSLNFQNKGQVSNNFVKSNNLVGENNDNSISKINQNHISEIFDEKNENNCEKNNKDASIISNKKVIEEKCFSSLQKLNCNEVPVDIKDARDILRNVIDYESYLMNYKKTEFIYSLLFNKMTSNDISSFLNSKSSYLLLTGEEIFRNDYSEDFANALTSKLSIIRQQKF